MTRARPSSNVASSHVASSRAAGWLLAGACSLALIGAAAFALAAERRAPPLFLDLASLPPAAPAIAAVTEVAPDVAVTPPPAPDVQHLAEAGPILPETATAPELAAAAALTLPEPDRLAAADLSIPPPPPEPKPKPKPERKNAEKKAKATETPVEKVVPDKKAAPASEARAPSPGFKVKGGAMSAAAYAKAVLKKVRATRKKSGAGKGTVVVGFSIAADGGLAEVQVLQSSGNATLDRIAVDHIRRSAPFPTPPPDAAGRGYSFEFVGK